VAATPQQQQYKRPSGAVLDKENGTGATSGTAAAALPVSALPLPSPEAVLSPMRSAVMDTGMTSPPASNFNATGATAVATDRSVSTFGTSGTANSRTQLLPASAGAGWSSSAPSTPTSGHSHPTASMGFGGKKKKVKSTTPTRGSGPILSPARGGGAGGTLGPSGGMLSRIGAKLGRKRPSSTPSSSMGGSASEDMHFSPSTPIRDGGMGSAAAAAAAAPHPSAADEFTLNRRNSGMPDVNSFPLGADGKKGGGSGSGSGSGGGLLRFKTKGGKIPSRKLNLPSTSVSALSAAVGISGSAHEEAGLLDDDGKPTDTSLDMDDANHMAALHAAHTATSPGIGGGFGGAAFRASPPRSGGFSQGIGVHSSLTAAAAAAAAATMSANCPLTPTETHARHSLPPAAALNTPPASSPSPLFVSAKKIGSEIRQRHGAKRRKGSNRRTKKARRSLRAAQKAAEAAAAAGVSSDSCGTETTDGNRGNISGPGGPRRLTSPPDRDDGAKAPSGSGVAGSKPVSVDDSFSSADSTLEGVRGQDVAEGDMSKCLEEMGLNTPTSNTDALQAAQSDRRSNAHGIARDLSMDIPAIRRSSPSDGQKVGFPLVLKTPSSPPGSDDGEGWGRSSSLTRRAEDFDAAPWHHDHDNFDDLDRSYSDTDTDTDSDDSTISSMGYLPMPKPPETATREEKSRFYWEQLYGAPPPRPPPSRPMPHLLAGLGTSTTSSQQRQAHYPAQGSWSASRAPPSKSCLSSRKKSAGGAVSGSTPMLSDRFGCLMHTSPALGHGTGSGAVAAIDVVATPGKNVGMYTPKKGSPITDDNTPPPGATNEKEAGDDGEMRPKHSVVFGNSKAAEFDTTCPTDQIVSLPDDEAMVRFPVEYVEATEEEEVMHEETVHNSDMLDDWEQSFDSLMDDDDDEDGDKDDARDSNEGLAFSPMDCDANNLSGCFADDDVTPLSHPKRPKKKKRRKSKHRYKDSGGEEDRRKSSLFFSPGGGSLLGSDDEMDQDPSPSQERREPRSMESAIHAEESNEEKAHDSLYFSPPSSEGARPGSFGATANDQASPATNASKDLFGSSEEMTVASMETLEVDQDEVDDGAMSALLMRALDAQSIDCLDRPLTSSCATDVNVATEYMLRRADGWSLSDTNLDSICQVKPTVLKSTPETLAAELQNGALPTPQSSTAAESSIASGATIMTAAEFCSKLAQTALYEWRTREVEMIQELSSSIQAVSNSYDENEKLMDRMLPPMSLSLSTATRGSTTSSGLAQQIQQLEKDVAKEERALDASTKRRNLTYAELEVERLTPNSERSYQLLSAIMPIQINSLGEDLLQTSFMNEASGLCTQISWKISCGASSDEASPQQLDVTSSPKAIQSFEASSITSLLDTTSSGQQSYLIRTLQSSVLRNFIMDNDACDDADYCAALDRFISHLTNRQPDFPSAFSAIVDFFNKMRMLELDVCAVDERADCTMEISCADKSLVKVLIRIAFEDDSSLGVSLHLDQFDGNSLPTFIPTDVTIVSIGSHAVEKELWRKLTSMIESTLRRRQGCNAFLFKDIVSSCVEEVMASREI